MAKNDKPAKGGGKAKAKPEKAKGAAKGSNGDARVVDLPAEEKAIMEKYPDRNIVKGSIRDAGTLKEFGNKRTVEIRCSGKGDSGKGCKVVRRVATSDLHQVGMCPDCIRQVRLDRRKDARASKRQEPRSTGKPKAKPAAKAPAAKTNPKAPAAKAPAPKAKPEPATKPAAAAGKKAKPNGAAPRKKPAPKPAPEPIRQVEPAPDDAPTHSEAPPERPTVNHPANDGPDQELERQLQEADG